MTALPYFPTKAHHCTLDRTSREAVVKPEAPVDGFFYKCSIPSVFVIQYLLRQPDVGYWQQQHQQ